MHTNTTTTSRSAVRFFVGAALIALSVAATACSSSPVAPSDAASVSGSMANMRNAEGGKGGNPEDSPRGKKSGYLVSGGRAE